MPDHQPFDLAQGKRTGREVELGQPLTPERTGREVELGPRISEGMVYIPAGEFLMGSNDGDNDEKPQRRVYLDEYSIDQYPVTVARYRKFCEATGRAMPQAPSWGWQSDGSVGDDHPIVNVSWNDAHAYCQWAGLRLPTEAEWEKAARATSDGSVGDGRTYPWGNEWDASRCANSVGANSLKGTVPVGSYPQGASPYGVYDMVGNVWEWCADWYGENYYRDAPARNPTGPTAGTWRVLRGGSWYSHYPDFFCAARRFRFNPESRVNAIGFRCAQGR